MRSGIIHNLPAQEYHSGPEVSSTGINIFLGKSPSHYRLYRDGKWSPASSGFSFGQAAHTYLLEKKQFFERYAVGPDARRNSKEWKDWAAENEGLELLKTSEFNENVRPLYDRACSSCRAARWLLDQPGRTEVSFFWTDSEAGLRCRARADKLITLSDRLIVVDLKTSRDASKQAFARAINSYGYHRQAEFYSRGLLEITGLTVTFVFLVIETGSMVAATYSIGPEKAEKARAQVDSALFEISQCQEIGYWPGYNQRIEVIDE